MKIYFLILTFLFSTVTFSQKITVEINDDNSSKDFYKSLKKVQKDYQIESLKNVNEKTIRIWKGQELFIFNKNSNYVRIFKNHKTGTSYLYKKSINGELDSFNVDKIKKLNAYYYIDCFPIAIEIIDSNNYFAKVVGCNKEIMTLINSLRTKYIESDIETFINTLPSGEYQDGMTTFIVNQAIQEDFSKTNLYKKIELELLVKEIKIENPTRQPLILINGKTAYFEDINKLDEAKLKSYKIISDKQKIVFGTSAEYGVIVIVTK